MFSPHSSNGFYHAPVSKALLGGVVLTSFALNIPLHTHKPLFSYTLTQIFQENQLWRLLTSKVAFLDTKDLICATMLIYYFRVFERRYGSRKFASTLFATSVLSMVLEVGSQFIARKLDLPLGEMPVGPYGMVFSMFVPYFCDIPRVAMTHILGIPVTGKSFTYIIGLQIASSSPESFVVAVCGVISAIIYKRNLLKVQQILKIPSFISNICDKTIGWLLKTPRPIGRDLAIGATLEIQRQIHIEKLEQQMALAQARQYRQRMNIGRPQLNMGAAAAFGQQQNYANAVRERRNIQPQPDGAGDVGNAVASSSGQQPAPQISEEQVGRLTEMGFTRDKVLEALHITNNDIAMATNILLQDLS